MTRCAYPAILVLVVAAVWPHQDEPLPAVAVQTSQPANEPDAVAALQDADTLLLAQLVTGEDPKAAVAIAWVLLNRAGCKGYGLSTCREPLLREVTRRRAFGTWLRGRWEPAWEPDGPATLRATADVRAVLLGSVADPTGSATHFHRAGTWVPGWAPSPRHWKRFGSHFFYRPVDSRGKLIKWRNK